MIRRQEAEREAVERLVRKYEREGYRVKHEPASAELPFDLGGYRPDLLVERAGRGYLIEVRASARRTSVDRLIEIAAEIERHPGWGFVLVTADQAGAESGVPDSGALLTESEVQSHLDRAGQLAREGIWEAALTYYWSALEAELRMRAVRRRLPIDRMPTSTLIRHLYSLGALSEEQFHTALSSLEVRNRVLHGQRVPGLEPDVSRLRELAQEVHAEPRQVWDEQSQDDSEIGEQGTGAAAIAASTREAALGEGDAEFLSSLPGQLRDVAQVLLESVRHRFPGELRRPHPDSVWHANRPNAFFAVRRIKKRGTLQFSVRGLPRRYEGRTSLSLKRGWGHKSVFEIGSLNEIPEALSLILTVGSEFSG